jgi:hypothetical protein
MIRLLRRVWWYILNRRALALWEGYIQKYETFGADPTWAQEHLDRLKAERDAL